MVTAEGRLWAFGIDSGEGSFEGYVDITADTLLNPRPYFVLLGCSIADDGMFRSRDGDFAWSSTFQELLAWKAQVLVESAPR